MSNDTPAGNTNFSVNISSNTGTAVFGHGNTVNVTASVPSLAALGLGAEQQARVEAALKALAEGRDDNADARELKTAAVAPDEPSRTRQVMGWLLKVAPHAAGLAGTIVNPVVGEIAKAATAWVAKALGPAS